MSTPSLTVHTLRREDDLPGRHGLVVSRRHGGAVQRNRVRRRARAALQRAGGIPPGFDSVIAVRPGEKVEVARLTEELGQILEKIRRNGGK
jgi:ribonuclease P protein component